MVGTERLSELLARQEQAQLLEAVAQVWASDGWRVTQVDDIWLRAMRNGQVRHLAVVSSEVEHTVETADLRMGTPVTVIYTGRTAVEDLPWSDTVQVTVLDSTGLARRCERTGVTNDVLDVIEHPRSGGPSLASVHLSFLLLVPLQAGLSVFTFVTYYDADGAQSIAVSPLGAVLSVLILVGMLSVALYNSTLHQRLMVGGFVLGGVCYTVVEYVLGITVSSIVGAVLTTVAVFVAALVVVGIERRTSVDLVHYLRPAERQRRPYCRHTDR